MADLENMAGEYINTAAEKDLFESLFADTGSRESISVKDWTAGWPAIVGGINGIPTSRQFNTLQYIADMKSFILYKAVVALQQAGATGIRIGPPQELEKNMILFETINGTNRIVRIRRKDNEGNEQVFDLAAVFEMAQERENIQSGDTLATLFGKIARFFEDMKANCFSDADDPFVQMTELTYKPPALRTKGTLYGLITNKRGLIINFYDRYISGRENPVIERTLYGVEKTGRTSLELDDTPYAGILSCIVYVKAGETVNRKKGMLYIVED